jgi:hypothetical protein
MRNRCTLALLVVALVLLVLPLSSQANSSYLPSCGDCTLDTPCWEECGWEPGKGGPVTCGEYGVCDY